MPSLLSLGATALNAANVGLRTTGHNIANVNTAGYSRQLAVQSTPTAQFTGVGYFGRGVEVATIRRVYDGFLTSQAHVATAQLGQAAASVALLERINSTLGTTDTGISQALSEFYGALDVASNHPTDLSARQAALSAATALAGQFNNVADRLADQRRSVEAQLRASIEEVNTSLADIATMNREIAGLQGSGQPANDLLDRRDALLRTLSEKLGVSVVMQDGNSMNLFAGNGQPLVVGGTASMLELQPDPFDPSHPQIGMRRGVSFTALDPRSFTGGSLAGLLRFADSDLSRVEDEVGRLALAVASAFNARHRMGLDAEGAPGQDLFSIDALATTRNAANTGTGTLGASVSDASALAASGYRVDYDGAQYTIMRLSDRAKTTYATLPQTHEGITFSMGGVPVAGDSFSVNAVREVASSMQVAIGRPAALALALPVASSLGASNLGSLQVMALTVPGPATGPNLAQGVTIQFTGPNTFNVTGTGTGNPTGLTYTPGQTLTYNGWSLKLDGVPRAGDTVTVSASTAWYGDNRNGLALGEIAGARLVDGLTLGEALSGLFGTVGSLVSSARAIADVQSAVREEAVAAEQSVARVNLDEEAARLLQYQQAYQAAAKLIATAQTVFDTLFDLMN